MKKCPFCAEEIQDEAIKCRFCNSFLSAAPPAAAAAAAPVPAPEAAPVQAAVPANAPPFARATQPETELDSDKKVLYSGIPSWKAFLGYYVSVVLGALILIVLLPKLRSDDVGMMTKALDVLVPIAAAAVFMFGINLYRRSIKFRVTSTLVETERGILRKRIDVLQLWRCRDVAYKQNLIDRILGIAHIEVHAQDATTPLIELVGMPASRQLFEQLRDSIELQRKNKNVYGVVS